MCLSGYTSQLSQGHAKRTLTSKGAPRRFRQEVCKFSGGDPLLRDLHAVFVLRPHVDLGQQRRGTLAAGTSPLATSSIFQITAVARSTFLNRLAASVRSRNAANGDSTTFVVCRWCQCSFGYR